MTQEEIRNEFDSKIRNDYIKKHPACHYCGKEAKHVHHIIPIVVGGDNRENNLISLCLECHSLIHNKNFSGTWKEAQRLGIERAKLEGKFKGGQRKKLSKSLYFSLKEQYETKQITKKEFAELLNVSRPTLNKILKEEDMYMKVMID